MCDTLGYRNFCMKCSHSTQRGADTICNNRKSRFYSMIVNQVLMAPCFKSKAEAAKEHLQAMFKEDPELARAYKETIEEMQKPENIERAARQITAVVKKITGGANGKEGLHQKEDNERNRF